MNISNLDKNLTKWIYTNVGLNKNSIISKLPYFFGLLPYELYVIPGMFVALFTMFYNQSFHPVQFHLLPHWFAFSIGLYMKHHLKRIRPGCNQEYGMGKLLDPGHCEGKTKFQSFPSGHTLIAFALATSLTLYLMDSSYDDSDKTFLGIDFANKTIRNITIALAFFVAAMISLHRISYGYHHVGDVLVGALIGSMIGFTSHTISNTARNVYLKEDKEKTVWSGVRGVGGLLAIFAFIHFFVFDFKKLSALQH
jgi:membrane-associated phospholipid phosphatase